MTIASFIVLIMYSVVAYDRDSFPPYFMPKSDNQYNSDAPIAVLGFIDSTLQVHRLLVGWRMNAFDVFGRIRERDRGRPRARNGSERESPVVGFIRLMRRARAVAFNG
jgi:hypothetical protein